MKKSENTDKLIPVVFIALILIVWEIVGRVGLIPSFMLPTPTLIFQALIKDRAVLRGHLKVTLTEAFIGLFFGVLAGIIFAVLMDINEKIRQALYPLMVLSQTVPTVAIAPLFVLWFGYGILPKVLLIALTTFFPIAVDVFEGLQSVGDEYLTLFKSMGASEYKTFTLLKIPMAVPHLFAGLKISVSYSIVGAVISEWLGGFSGLGVYMTRVKKAYAFDKMFAVIFLISITSLFLMWSVNLLRRFFVKWED